jgi:riboflavin biosynthesis pyrimidine reductase
VHPGSSELIDLDDATSRDRLLELYRPPSTPWLRLNLITSVSGSAAGSDGTSETLTNPADRKILGVIRELADVVLIGAQSVRAEGFQLPKRARLAVVTASGDLSGHRIEASDGRVFVLCPAAAMDLARSLEGAEIIVVADVDGRMTPEAIIAALHERGFTSIVCEGGPNLAAQLVSAGLVDEACLSTSPSLGGPSLPLLGDGVAPVGLELSQLLIDDSSGLYARWAMPTASRR